MGEAQRERRAFSGEAFRGSGRCCRPQAASAGLKGEAFREFWACFRARRVAKDAQAVKGEEMREPELTLACGLEAQRIRQR
jgi:hypothetical protein